MSVGSRNQKLRRLSSVGCHDMSKVAVINSSGLLDLLNAVVGVYETEVWPSSAICDLTTSFRIHIVCALQET